ncbi:palmitoyltransferase ZDHHC15A-like isoform X2 [Sycon ciliatum]|uniref:palmitoyltransferase ZDHHC15A-like isoform X1 n=1 Tax=Sycon ciliatum TaxID=27933 RepID=UPI0020A9AB18|eukprot:scpid62524/ scgid30634/ Palmitoyltransferase ZDHHC2; Reduced expression associated with metastasis protein; Reduced expression in cancer protein; Zinc finger DHHC domain-containing protein 2; Zinc finger protein 372
MPRQTRSTCILLDLCTRCFTGFPVIFVVCLLLWAFYAYNVVLCGQLIDSIAERVLLGTAFSTLWVMVLLSYYRAINTPAGEPPAQFRLSDAQIAEYDALSQDDKSAELDAKAEYINALGSKLPISTRLPNGNIRYCVPCGLIKPDRSHHCSMCRTCVLKMDHHCPWVNNCVGFGNYKFFVLFLSYTTLFCLYTVCSVLPTFIASWGDMGFGNHHRSGSHGTNTTDAADAGLNTSQRLQIIFLFFLAAVFSFSVAFLDFFHIYLTLTNHTTLEQGRPVHLVHGKDANAYDQGYRRNVQQVLGRDTLFWFLPIGSGVGNGYEFPLRKDHAGRSEGDSLLACGEQNPVSGDESDRV